MNQLFQPIQWIKIKHVNYFIFLVLPLIYFLNTQSVMHHHGEYYKTALDPEYFHVYNGILIGAGNLNVQYIAHPGTPLQYLIGISSRIIHFFQPDEVYAQDFINDPEKFIRAAILFIAVIVSILLYLAGWYIFRFSGSYFIPLIFQLSIFGNSALLEISGRLLPESMLVIPIILMGILILKYIFTEYDQKKYILDVILFSMIIGFGIAIKLSFAAMFFLPLIMYKTKFKLKGQYVLYTAMFTGIFAYPIIVNLAEFWKWFSTVFMRSGRHAAGDQSFIDMNSIPDNFDYFFNFDKVFFYVLVLSIAINIIYLAVGLMKRPMLESKAFRALSGINVAMILVVGLTLKRFSLHYFMPYYMFKYIMILVIAVIVLDLLRNISFKYLKLALYGLISFFLIYNAFSETRVLRSTLNGIHSDVKKRSEISEHITSLVPLRSPIIYTAPYNGAPFIEFAHTCGFMLTYNQKSYFKPFLQKKFPYSFHYVYWADQFNHWENLVDFQHILDKTRYSFYVYIGLNQQNDLPVIEERIWKVLDQDSVKVKVLYNDKHTGEQLIEYELKPRPELFINGYAMEEIQVVIDRIKGTPEWLETVEKKAVKQKISVDSMMVLDAIWTLENY